MRQSSKCARFLSLLVNCFPWVREYRLHRKIRHKRLKIQLKLPKDEPKHLRRYVILSGSIRRL